MLKPNTAWTLIRSNWVIIWSHKIVGFSTLLQLSVLALAWSRLPPLVPLWYSKPWGTDQLAPPIFLSVLPLISMLTHLINTSIAMYITTDYLIFTQSLCLSSVIVSVLSLISIVKIIFLVL